MLVPQDYGTIQILRFCYAFRCSQTRTLIVFDPTKREWINGCTAGGLIVFDPTKREGINGCTAGGFYQSFARIWVDLNSQLTAPQDRGSTTTASAYIMH